jgi:hypothetical protein
MKFCKDCKHHRPELSADGGSLLPGFFMHMPATCYGSPEPIVNLVTGESNAYAGYCKDVRANGTKCGTSAVWFVPATLDGRLAALEDNT